ncbi:hypothetical protein HHK36_028348 [Tetracentron sinense]|uniref:Uncharacterized protein n=1 Tax=Tetracentron sinense TaxID=13715 RepID=A0A834YFM9_TETSI|nr:hypothetical protein HHK36_028348 [Tetracentron sinense]
MSTLSSFSLKNTSTTTFYHADTHTHQKATTASTKFHKVVARSSKAHNKRLVLDTAPVLQYYSNYPSNTKTKKKKNSSKSKGEEVVTLIDHLITFFYKFINPPLHSSVDPNYVLSGNFAPVGELPPTECTVVCGELPSSLNGAYLRNGPNPQHPPHGPHHLFEGDGMLHSLLLSGGRATFCSRYVQTYKYTLERIAGFPTFPNVLSGFYGLADIARCAIAIARVLTGQINLMRGFGLANTSLAFFSNRLFALGESDLPYAVRLTPEGDVETLERCCFNGRPFMNMTAHPKIDIHTGEMFAFRCSPVPPYLTFFRFDAKGSKQPDVPIFSMTRPTFVHDFAITKRYAVFPETQLEMKPENLVALRGMPVASDPSKVPRIGVIPRYASSESELRWYTVPGYSAMHVTNAWEDEEEGIILIAPNAVSIENIFHRIEMVHFSLEKVRIDMRTGMVSRTCLDTRSLELGSINPAYVGKKNRYAYMGVGEVVPKMSGVVKIDLELERAVSSRFYGPGCFGGESIFVARDADDSEADEDDGYIVSFVHNENTGDSKFEVMDAKSPMLDIVATVKLPGRVPYGFHGLFVTQKNLLKQL